MKEISKCIGDIGRANLSIFTTLDLTSGFWQMKLDPESQPLTAFTIPEQLHKEPASLSLNNILTNCEQKHKEPVSWSFINSVMISEQKQSEPVQWSFSNAVAVLDQKHTEPDHNSFAKATGKQQHKEPVLLPTADCEQNRATTGCPLGWETERARGGGKGYCGLGN